jgi:ureidoglycolate amidohydrolase
MPCLPLLFAFSFFLLTCSKAATPSSRLSHTINASRVIEQLTALHLLSDAPLPAVTRVLYTPQDLKARAFLRARGAEAGLFVREDAVGNMFMRLPGSTGEAGAVGTGSHYDAIPVSGMYDGTLGVLGGLEALRALREAGFQNARDLEVLAFTSEEPTRFGTSCIGSRALVGQMGPRELRKLVDADGVTFDQAREAAGYNGELDGVLLEDGYYSAFLELHIEQGRRLEQRGLDIGVVTAIAGPLSADATFEGPGGHAGGMIMLDRADAALAAAEFALAVEAASLATASPDNVATTGLFSILPGAENSIGRFARVSLDARDVDLVRRDGVVAAARAAMDAIAEKRGVTTSFNIRSSDAPALCDVEVVAAATRAANVMGYSNTQFASRAYHDSLLMAAKFPTGMIFIPCRNGVSHHPTEFSSQEQIEKGIFTLALTLADLAGGKWVDVDTCSDEL